MLPMKFTLQSVRAAILTVMLALAASCALAADTVRVAYLTDGPAERNYLPLDLVKKEIAALLGREFTVEFPERYQVHGDWRVDGIEATLNTLLADPQVDVVLTMGIIATHIAAHLPQLPKPVIGVAVADVVLQEFPHVDGVSGKTNFVYLADDHTVGADLELFHRLLNYQHLAIPADRLVFEALPELPRLAADAAERLAVKISVIPAGDDAAAVLEALPADIDAVYVPPLTRFSTPELEILGAGLIDRQLPSFSLQGKQYLEAGILMTGAGRQVDLTRAARRVALNLQSILLGEPAAKLKVSLSQPQKLAINMATARQINYSPRWQDLEGAIVLHADALDDQSATTLLQALQMSLERNLAFQVQAVAPLSAEAEREVARAALLPQLAATANATTIDADRANPLAQAEHSGQLGLEASQLLYSETAWAGYQVAKFVKEAEDEALRVAALDTLASTASAYLNVLSAQAQSAVRRSNVTVTETNLELAQGRRRIGQSGRADVLRFQSELAIDRQSLYAAQAQVEAALVELKRVLNLSQDEPLAVNDDGIPRLLGLLAEPRYQRLFNNALRWRLMRDYVAERATEAAPELSQNSALARAAERQLLATERAYYVPDLSLVGQSATRFLRGGNGASLAGTGRNEDDWSIGVQARLPLFLGGERPARKAGARYALTRTQLQQQQIRTDVRARVLAAMERVAGSYPAIRLSREAAVAAGDNLDLVTDAYRAGAASITELNDAQDAALTAELSAAQARYQFMLDYVGVLRGSADFDVLLLPDGLEQWYAEVTAYLSERGVTP